MHRCTVTDCSLPVLNEMRGLCSTHYQRWQRTGSATSQGQPCGTCGGTIHRGNCGATPACCHTVHGCKVDSCTRLAKIRSAGMCNLHYQRALRGAEVQSDPPCKNCGRKTARRNENGPWPSYCSDECKRDMRAKESRAHYVSKAFVGPRPCRVCGIVFTWRNGSTTRCDECRAVGAVDLGFCSTCGDVFRAAKDQRFCGRDCAVDWLSEYNRLPLGDSYSPTSKGHQARAERYGVQSEPVDRRKVFDRDNWLCGLCGVPVDPDLVWPNPGSASLDHVIPISRGGSHVYTNVQTAHLRCNIIKGAKLEAVA